MSNNNLSEVMQSLFKGMDSVLSTKTVVGEPTQIGDVIILPLVDVSFGVAAGAALGDTKNNGGGGLGGKMSPNAVLVIKDGKAEMKSAICPDKICVKHRPIDKSGQTIVCLPEKIVVKIIAEGEEKVPDTVA